MKRFIQAISNAPNLTYLNLKDFTLNLNDMEWIHADAPNLVSLLLEDITLDIIPDTDLALSRNSIRLIDNNGSDLVKSPARYVRFLGFHFDDDN